MATPTNQEMLDNVNTAINNILTGGVAQSYNIGGRNIQRYSLQELLDLRQVLQAGLAAEKKGGTRNYVSFERPS